MSLVRYQKALSRGMNHDQAMKYATGKDTPYGKKLKRMAKKRRSKKTRKVSVKGKGKRVVFIGKIFTPKKKSSRRRY